MTDAPQLSVAMIVRNEADTICTTLESIVAIADQIVVFDTSDDDSTKEAAASFDTTWIEGEWDDDFSAARNSCLDHVKGAWVLWLDSGETLSAEDAASLQTFVDTQADVRKVYMMIVATAPVNVADEGEQVGRLRLAPNLAGLHYRGRVRESIEESALALGLSLEGLPQRIERGRHEHDADRKATRAQRDLRIVDVETAASGPSPKLCNIAGAAHHDLGDFEAAARSFAMAVDTSQRGSNELLEAYYGLLSTLDGILEGDERQVQLCVQALEVFPVDAQLLCAMGGYLQRQQRLDLAMRSYETAYRFGKINPVVWHVGRIHEISAVCFGLALQLQGREEESLNVMQEAVSRYPESQALKRQLLNSLIRQPLRDDALALIDELGVDDAEAMRSTVRGACLAVEENWLAANAYLKIAFESGCRDPLCLRWYCVTLLRQELADEAKAVLDEWELVESGNAELQSYRELVSDSTATLSPATHRVDKAGTTNSPSETNLGVSDGPE